MVKVYEEVGENTIKLFEKEATKIAIAQGRLPEKKYGNTR